MSFYKIIGGIQNYDWGTKNEQAFIPQLLNLDIAKDVPYAEYWIGTHKNLPSSILIDDKKMSLDAFIETFNNITGQYFNNKYTSLPFLLKILSIGEPLSIQAHPNKDQAKILHQKDPKNYPDDNHKPEIAIAIDTLKALVGIKNLKDLKIVFEKYPEIKEYLNLFLDTNNSLPLDIYKSYIKFSTDNVSYQTLTTKIYDKIQTQNDFLSEIYKFSFNKYGANDIGLLSIFLLNFVELKQGEGIFLSAGIPHAYLAGNIVECMANSDNVIRVGLTPKFKDKDALIDIIKFQDSLDIYKPNSNYYKFPLPDNIEFTIDVVSNTSEYDLETKDKFYFLLNLATELTVCNSKSNFIVNKGETIFIPANSIITLKSQNILTYLVSVK